MRNSVDKIQLCRYDYDALDRQCGCTIIQQPAFQRFHCKSRLATELQGAARWSLFQHDDQLLAQHTHLGASTTTLLLASDQQRSVLNALYTARLHPLAYSPYGHRPAHSGLLSLLGFNGERPDPVTGHYHLGNGYRQFNPVLMRFNSPDGWSPFGEGGLNAYGYCSGNPVNQIDPTGHTKVAISVFDKIFKNTHKLVTNRKTYRPAHFSTAKNNIIKNFGGDTKLELLATSTKTEPDAIVAKAMAAMHKPRRLPPLADGEDLNEYLTKLSTYISDLSAQRNTYRELLKSPAHLQHLSTRELNTIKLNKIDVKNELSHSINYSLDFRSPGPDTTHFSVKTWTQAAIRKRTQ